MSISAILSIESGEKKRKYKTKQKKLILCIFWFFLFVLEYVFAGELVKLRLETKSSNKSKISISGGKIQGNQSI